ncbi:MAG: ferritin-like domain-containing protein [Clostridia bacterium]|nr:ferritin-like domain-containing protein [Clostridia bacterium]
MDNKVINELNAYLKGEYMAIQSYDKFISELQDENVKKEMQNIQQDHKEHASTIARRIQELGGKPVEGTGFAGLMADAKAAFESMKKRSPLQIIKEAYDGEDKGISVAHETVKGDLDEESRKMIEGMLKKDNEHLKTMSRLISDYENRH